MPAWAGRSSKHFPEDLRDIYQFLRHTAARWKGRVQAFEPWNEADIDMFGGHTGAEMASLQKAAYLGLKAGNPDVIALRDAFLVPPDSSNLQVRQIDGAEYLAAAEKGIDVLLVDAFDRTGFAPSLANREFVEQAHAKLTGNGILVVNLAGDEQAYDGLIAVIMQVFDDQVIVVPVREDDNNMLLAFRNPLFEPNWRRLRASAKELRAKYGLDFPDFLKKVERSAKLGLARREAERRY